MSEYALLMNGEFKEIRHYEERPDNIPHKGVEWLSVDYRQAEEASSVREGETWVNYYVPERRKITKALIMERLTDEQLDTALSLMSTRQKERWRMPGHPEVYVDDPEVIGLIQAVGANSTEVLS